MTNPQESKDIFSICQKNVDKFFSEVEKSTPKYQESAAKLQKNYIAAWKNVINSSITIQQEYASKAGLNINMPEEMIKAIQSMTERVATAYQNQNKIVFDSTQTSKKIFDVFSENTQIFSSLNKNMMELMASGMKKYTQN